jgi:hypothetical protein
MYLVKYMAHVGFEKYMNERDRLKLCTFICSNMAHT